MPISETLLEGVPSDKCVGPLTNYQAIKESYEKTIAATPPIPTRIAGTAIFYFVDPTGMPSTEYPMVVLLSGYEEAPPLTEDEYTRLHRHYLTDGSVDALFSRLITNHLHRIVTGSVPTPLEGSSDAIESRALRDYLFPKDCTYSSVGMVVSGEEGEVYAAMRADCKRVQHVPYYEDMSESTVVQGSPMDSLTQLARDYALATAPDNPKESKNLFSLKGEFTLMFLLGNFENPNFIRDEQYSIVSVHVQGPSSQTHCFTDEEINAAEEYYYTHNPNAGAEPNRETGILYGIFGVAFCKFARDQDPSYVPHPMMAGTDILPATNAVLSRLITKTNVVAVLMLIRPDSSTGAAGYVRLFEHGPSNAVARVN